jgi:hypothetical protein
MPLFAHGELRAAGTCRYHHLSVSVTAGMTKPPGHMQKEYTPSVDLRHKAIFRRRQPWTSSLRIMILDGTINACGCSSRTPTARAFARCGWMLRTDIVDIPCGMPCGKDDGAKELDGTLRRAVGRHDAPALGHCPESSESSDVRTNLSATPMIVCDRFYDLRQAIGPDMRPRVGKDVGTRPMLAE